MKQNEEEKNKTEQQKEQTSKLKQAYQFYHKNQYNQALVIYTEIINSDDGSFSSQIKLEALKNRVSLFLAMKQQQKAVADCESYIKQNQKQVSPQMYILYITVLIKANKLSKANQISEQALQKYPYHKKLKQIGKLSKQKHIAFDQELYVQHMFEKLCQHPKLREYLKQESFLTKIQRLIRNPSLGPALQKIDPRIKQAADFMMMAENDQE